LRAPSTGASPCRLVPQDPPPAASTVLVDCRPQALAEGLGLVLRVRCAHRRARLVAGKDAGRRPIRREGQDEDAASSGSGRRACAVAARTGRRRLGAQAATTRRGHRAHRRHWQQGDRLDWQSLAASAGSRSRCATPPGSVSLPAGQPPAGTPPARHQRRVRRPQLGRLSSAPVSGGTVVAQDPLRPSQRSSRLGIRLSVCRPRPA
jgi:hypothetical protein